MLLALALSGCGGPPAVQLVSTLKTALDTKCVTARLLNMDDICPQPKEPGPEPARFDVKLDGYETTLRIGNDIELELDTIKNPVTQASVHPEMVLPEGLVTKHGKLAASKVFRFHKQDGKAYDHSGKYAAFGRFAYAS